MSMNILKYNLCATYLSQRLFSSTIVFNLCLGLQTGCPVQEPPEEDCPTPDKDKKGKDAKDAKNIKAMKLFDTRSGFSLLENQAMVRVVDRG